MMHTSMRGIKKQYIRLIQGAVLSLGSPVGWLLIQYFQGYPVSQQLTDQQGLYWYLTLGTLLSFAGFGWYVGHSEEKRKELSITDALTGCFNFRYFHERFEQELERAKRGDHILSMLVLDIDKFKQVNDQYGHPAGDKILVNTCQTIRNNLRNYEVFCRIGGEEFAVLALQSDLSDAVEIAQRIRTKIKAQTVYIDDNQAVKITISIGVSTYQAGDNIDSMLSRADKAMYRAKYGGRDRVEVES